MAPSLPGRQSSLGSPRLRHRREASRDRLQSEADPYTSGAAHG